MLIKLTGRAAQIIIGDVCELAATYYEVLCIGEDGHWLEAAGGGEGGKLMRLEESQRVCVLRLATGAAEAALMSAHNSALGAQLYLTPPMVESRKHILGLNLESDVMETIATS